MERVGFFEEEAKSFSMMRLVVFMGFILGGVVSLWGMVLLTMAVTGVLAGKAGAFELVGPLTMVVGGGLGLALGGEGFKVLQQRGEVKANGGGEGK